ncbi:signal transduction histidine kinase [Herbaspirillum sp. CF444]|uniref:hybrid sensor histidine kinase/response regulator n=1 Tax=Herbaspirillum sp. CF444 TaxID=1144319 RepID=UPI00027233B5|nr:ATP-binding protein [Herbaspirillum sp. CF444]EJL88734.1 signal transduction histidine kinase [Herbaspirillum sp. CF444]
MPRQILALSERYYRRMLYGCAALLSVAIICALLFLGYSAFSQFRERQVGLFISKREQIKAEADRLAARVTQFAEMYGRLQRLYQNDILSPEGYLTKPEGGGIFTTPDTLTVVPFSIVGNLTPTRDRAYLSSLLQLLRQASALPIFNPAEPGVTLNGYLYTSDHSFLAISPPLASEEARIVGQQGSHTFIGNMGLQVDAAFAREFARAADAQGSVGHKVIWWSPSGNAPIARDAITGLAVQIPLTNSHVATAVFSVPGKQFHQFFMSNESVPGLFVLDAGNNGRLLSDWHFPFDNTVLGHVRDKSGQAARDGNHITYFRVGSYFFITQNIDAPGWTVVYSFTWRDIIDGLHGDFTIGAFWGLFALFFVWAATLYFDKFVISPLQKKALALIETRQFSQTIIDTLPVGIAVYAFGTGQVVLQNSVASQMLEHSLIPHSEFYAQIVRECNLLGQHSESDLDHSMIEAEIRLRDGGASYLGSVWARTRFAGQDVVLLGMIDMNMHKAHEALVLEAKTMADKANQAKSMFLAQVSHEIRTPLHGAIGHMELLARDDLKDQQRQRVELIRHAFDMLMSLVNDILDVTKIEATSIELNSTLVNVNDLLEECAQLFAPLALNKGLQFYCLPSPAFEEPLLGDRQRLMQILQNLVGNAVKFTSHGAITLAVTRMTSEDLAGVVRFEVTDTGIGVSLAARQRIFESLEQADETISSRFGGTGLGLSLCRRLAELMGGRITLTSKEGEGSVFGAEIPLASTAYQPAAQTRPLSNRVIALHCRVAVLREMLCSYLQHWGAEVQVAPCEGHVDIELVAQDCDEKRLDSDTKVVSIRADVVRHGTTHGGSGQVSAFDRKSWILALADSGSADLPAIRTEVPVPNGRGDLDILVAEDDHVNLTLIEHQLEALGYRSVRLTRDGAEALEQWQSKRPDILITDLGMPRLDGIALATEIRKQDARAVIVAATAVSHSKSDDLRLSIFNEVIYKPISINTLQRILEGLWPVSSESKFESDGCAASLEEVLRQAFSQSWPKERSKLIEAIEDGDTPLIIRLLHRLQGGLQALGQDAMAGESLALQSGLAGGDLDAYNRCKQWISEVERWIKQ